MVILRFKSEEPSLDPSSPMEVFDKIKLVFEVLHKYLLSRYPLPLGTRLRSVPCSCIWSRSFLEYLVVKLH